MLFLRINVPESHLDVFDIVRVILCFATPAFVMLSEALIARSYYKKLPEGFLSKRLKFIVAPFIVFAVVSEFVKVFVVGEPFDSERLTRYLMGQYHGWFVIVILQFYVMHMLIVKLKLSQLNIVLLSCLICYFQYKYISPQLDHKDYKFAFTTWAAFFCCGYFIGRYYDEVINFIKNNGSVIFSFVILGIIISSLNFVYDGKLVHSKLFENIPLTISLFCFLLFLGLKFGDDWWVQTVSRSSYGIYLVHWPIIIIYTTYIQWNAMPYLIALPLLFVLAAITSIIVVRTMNKLPFGDYIVGKDNYRPQPKS